MKMARGKLGTARATFFPGLRVKRKTKLALASAGPGALRVAKTKEQRLDIIRRVLEEPGRYGEAEVLRVLDGHVWYEHSEDAPPRSNNRLWWPRVSAVAQ
jgi:hypothetical protein